MATAVQLKNTAFAANPLVAAGNLANAQMIGGRALIRFCPVGLCCFEV